MHDYRPCISQKNGVSKTDEFDRSRVLFACKKNALWTQVTMEYVVAVTVSNCLRNLPHVVTAARHIQIHRKAVVNIKQTYTFYDCIFTKKTVANLWLANQMPYILANSQMKSRLLMLTYKYNVTMLMSSIAEGRDYLKGIKNPSISLLVIPRWYLTPRFDWVFNILWDWD